MSSIRLHDHFARWRRRAEEGATAVEYGIMVALIAAVIVAVVAVLGRQARTGLCTVAQEVATSGEDGEAMPEAPEDC